MKKDYTGNLRCATCGSDVHFEFNEDQSYIKCTMCNREYLGGIDELIKFNEEAIEEVKRKITDDAQDYIQKQIGKAFKGNKHIKFK